MRVKEITKPAKREFSIELDYREARCLATLLYQTKNSSLQDSSAKGVYSELYSELEIRLRENGH